MEGNLLPHVENEEEMIDVEDSPKDGQSPPPNERPNQDIAIMT